MQIATTPTTIISTTSSDQIKTHFFNNSLFISWAIYLFYYLAQHRYEIESYSTIFFIFVFILTILLFYIVVFPEKNRSTLLWSGVSMAFTSYLFYKWETLNNHDFLAIYWTWAITISTFFKDQMQNQVLAKNAHYILGMTMLFSALQKIFSPEYMDGSFLYASFLTDSRFDTIVGAFIKNYEKINQLNDQVLNDFYLHGHNVLLLGKNESLFYVARWVGNLTLIFEFILGILFLLPTQKKFFMISKHLLLLFFIYGIYTFLPIFNFAYILISMGLAASLSFKQRKDYQKWGRRYFFATIYIIFCSNLPKDYFPLINIFTYLKNLI